MTIDGCLFQSSVPCSMFAVVADAGQSNLENSHLGFAKTFAMIFLMLGPFKVLIPLTALTAGLQHRDQMRMASVSIMYAAIMLLTAGLIARNILESFDISVPVRALAGGLILFLMALRTVLSDTSATAVKLTPLPSLQRAVAINPLAFLIIVTPYGLAALIAFIALSQGNAQVTAAIVLMVIVTMVIDWAAMSYAGPILSHFGTALQIIAVILGVVQTALGLQAIVRSLGRLEGVG
jgi:multiple antibiotic resistance protein